MDWLCWPRFDSGACFAALLGTPEHGTWRIAPVHPHLRISRAYRDATLVLETVFATPEGEVALIDVMPVGTAGSHLVRLVQGRLGSVGMQMFLAPRFDTGSVVPWVAGLPGEPGSMAVAGPDITALRTPVKLHEHESGTWASFAVSAGETIPFVLSHGPSHLGPPPGIDPLEALQRTEKFWRDWSGRGTYHGPEAAAVQRSLITLKALICRATGGIVAAPTTSLPEALGGVRNWDYRYCWLRDASLALLALLAGGYAEEAQAWRDWLRRSIAGRVDQLQIMYGLAGERRLIENQADWLPGYQGARPVRIGNAAHGQLQLDVFGEVAEVLHQARARPAAGRKVGSCNAG